jgi:hypothetical protein
MELLAVYSFDAYIYIRGEMTEIPSWPNHKMQHARKNVKRAASFLISTATGAWHCAGTFDPSGKYAVN